MHECVRDLLSYHKEKAAQLVQVNGLLQVAETDSPRVRTELLDLIYSFRGEPERAHHHNEELILFELTKTAMPVHGLIQGIAGEHADFGRIVGRLCGQIEDAVVEPAVLVAEVEWFIRQYDEHATKEESILFPAADRYLDPEAWSRVVERWNSPD